MIYVVTCCFGRTELYGKTLTVSAFGAVPFIKVWIDPTTKKMAYGGTDIDILTELAKKFLFRVKPKRERTWGSLIKGRWYGTIGSVSNGTSHIGIGHIRYGGTLVDVFKDLF